MSALPYLCSARPVAPAKETARGNILPPTGVHLVQMANGRSAMETWGSRQREEERQAYMRRLLVSIALGVVIGGTLGTLRLLTTIFCSALALAGITLAVRSAQLTAVLAGRDLEPALAGAEEA